MRGLVHWCKRYKRFKVCPLSPRPRIPALSARLPCPPPRLLGASVKPPPPEFYKLQRAAEEKARASSQAEKEAMPELPSPEDMPRTPEPLPSPISLGGLAERAGVEVSEDEGESPLQSLRERTEDVSEDIEAEDSAAPKEEPEDPEPPMELEQEGGG